MYKIRGKDNKDLGPFTAVVVQQWISAGRTDEDTLLLKVGDRTWKPLSDFQEFTIKAPSVETTEEPRRRSSSSRSPDSTPPIVMRSRLAMVSVILGALGMAGITAVAGLVTGVLALKIIARSGGRVSGTGLAITGTVLSASMLLVFVPAMSGLFIVPLLEKRQQAAEDTCFENMRHLNHSLQTFARNHDNLLPTAEGWMDQLSQDQLVIRSGPGLQCPARTDLFYAYAFNEALSGLAPDQIPPDTVLIFESNLGWNGHGSVEDMASSRHGGRLLVGFADGSIQRVPAWHLSQLRWLPHTSP